MSTKFFPPSFEEKSYNCPFCGVYSRQYWGPVQHYPDAYPNYKIVNLQVTFCEKCGNQSYWINEKMVYPVESIAPQPIDDMPENVIIDYNEAREVVNISPRSAAALLRLALQKLMPHLGGSGEKLNDDIASLVKEGLRSEIQQSLDLVRVIGNNAVHPGQLDLRDDKDTALALFDLINIIVEDRIVQPKRIKALYDKIPSSTKKAIKKRDAQ